MIWQDVYITLHEYAGVAALVGTRIYPSIVNQAPIYPCISHFRVSEEGIVTLGGAAPEQNPHWQIDAWATTYSGAAALMDQIRAAMDAASLFKAVLLNVQDLYEPDTNIHHVLAEFSLWAKA